MEERITEEHLERFKEENKREVVGKSELTEREREIVEKIYEEAKMPVEMTDADFKCGERELDIRGLSRKNRDQMLYRASMLSVAYLRRVNDSLIDIIRLLMVELRTQGVQNIAQKIDETIESLSGELGGKAD